MFRISRLINDKNSVTKKSSDTDMSENNDTKWQFCTHDIEK